MKDNKRIAVISLGRKGAGPVIGLKLAEVLESDFEILLIHSKQSELFKDINSSTLKSKAISTFNNIIGLLVTFFLPIRIFNLISITRKFRPDVIIWPMIHPWSSLINICFKKCSIISLLHDIIPHAGVNRIIWKFYTKSLIFTSDSLILLSLESKKQISNTKIKSKSVVIPLPIFDFYSEEKSDTLLSKKEDNKTLIFFGRIRPYKNIALLLDAFNLIKKEYKEIKLIIAGEGDISPFQERVNNDTSIELINEWIPNSEVSKIFSRAYISVLPYNEATQSGVIPLSYEFNVPVIASERGGIKNQVINGKTGYLIADNKAELFAEACIRLIGDKNLYNEMTENIKEYSKELSWNKSKNIIKKTIGQL